MYELNQIGYSYKIDSPVASPALSGISLTLNKGELVGLIGHTGSGKSTLAQIMAGLLVPTTGTASFNGKPMFVKKKFDRALRGKIGLVFQYPEYQLFEETVLKDICFGPLNLGCSKEEAVARAEQAAEQIGLSSSFFDKAPLSLSGGEKRRVAIAGVLAMQPEVLLLDEPTAGLDPEGRDELFALLKNLHEKTKNTMLLITHSMEFVSGFSERILVLKKGTLHMDGTPDEVFSDEEKLHEAGLSLPPAARLFADLGLHETPPFTVEEAAMRLLPLLKGGDRPCK